eukprot:TRINITY_DN75919_c0_g1_i1.p1 TRINITY_DN75919_c0_g1~~TRINITY_DN75919_c0_g1_i1.p1  ORF type:complete len:506 (-),score=97.32 TRINITY_DN75919_c0_g1_i1:39-1556(-)
MIAAPSAAFVATPCSRSAGSRSLPVSASSREYSRHRAAAVRPRQHGSGTTSPSERNAVVAAGVALFGVSAAAASRRRRASGVSLARYGWTRGSRFGAGRRRHHAGVVVSKALPMDIDGSAFTDLQSSLALALQLPDVNSVQGVVSVVGTLALALVCHESGHYFCAKSVKLPSEEFGLGFGPELVNFGTDSAGTTFLIRSIPIGGYVKFNDKKTVAVGDGEVATMVTEFDALPPPARLWVLSGGVLANLASAWAVLFTAGMTSGFPRSEPKPGILVSEVKGEAIARTGLQQGDVLMRIGDLDLSEPGQRVGPTVDFIHKLAPKVPVELIVQRASEQVKLDVLPLSDPNGQQRLGVLINSNVEKLLAKTTDPAEAAAVALQTMQQMLGDQLAGLSSVVGSIGGGSSGGGEVVGPVGMVQQGEQLAASEGLLGLAIFFVSINLNLALLNALPVPSLDGGRAVFVVLEALQGKRLDEQKRVDIESAFILLVLIFIAGLTFKDVSKLVMP